MSPTQVLTIRTIFERSGSTKIQLRVDDICWKSGVENKLLRGPRGVAVWYMHGVQFSTCVHMLLGPHRRMIRHEHMCGTYLYFELNVQHVGTLR